MIAYKLTTTALEKSTSAILELDDSIETFSSKPKIFTTFIAHLDKKQKCISIRFLEKHRERLIKQGQELNLGFTNYLAQKPSDIKDSLSQIISENLNNFTSTELIIRLVLQKNFLQIFIDSHQSRLQHKTAISLLSYAGERYLPHLKTSVTRISRLALENAREQDCDEALLVDDNTLITECAWANIFWVEKNKILFTTNNEILEGVTRNEIIKHFNCQFKNISLEELIIEAKEIFTTQSTGGITAVDKIDNNKIGQESIGALTREISDWYSAKGETWELS